MDVVDLLQNQHSETVKVLERLLSSKDAEKEELTRELIRKLRHHSAIEEEILHPFVRQDVPELEEEVLADLEEHRSVALLLDR